MAQDVEKLIPDAVMTTQNTINGVTIDDFKILKKSTINVIHHDAIRSLHNEYIELKKVQETLLSELELIKKNL